MTQTHQELREAFFKWLWGRNFASLLANQGKIVDWWLLKIDELTTTKDKEISSKLADQKQKVIEMANKYVKENRHKVERIDRYVLDELISKLKEN